MTRQTQGAIVVAALLAAAVVLIVVELSLGARDYGTVTLDDPCTTTVSFEGSGFDATVQRIALSGLNGAACELGTSREELVLSFAPEVGTTPIPWTPEKAEEAIRAGLLRAIDDEEARGTLGEIEALLLRELVERAPLDLIFEASDLIRALLDVF